MTCEKFEALLPDWLLAPPGQPAQLPAEAERHLTDCAPCRREWSEMRATLGLLDEWKAPEPSAYFSTRLAARLRDEKRSTAPGWTERIRARLLFGNGFRLKPAMAAAVAVLVVVAGVGSYEGFESLHRASSAQPAVSATIQDLEFLDANAQTFRELAAFDDSDAAPGPIGGPSH